MWEAGTTSSWVGLSETTWGSGLRAGTSQPKGVSELLLGPWYHGPFGSKSGEIDFGAEAKGDTDELVLRWYDFVLKGISNGIEKERPVKIFVMGKNLWREEEDWPLPRAQSRRYYLHSSGGARSLKGDGSLSLTEPKSEAPDTFVYNPAEPVPTHGGGLCCDNDRLASGAFDQRPIEARSDVLIFSTPAFKEDFEVTGPVAVELYISSSAIDTDFTAKLVDVWPNGFAQNLTDGILRARYRNSPSKPEYMNPGEIYRVTVDLWATSNVFLTGHQLRLEISSSNFPRFDRNLNTGEDPGQAIRPVSANNTVYHDRSSLAPISERLRPLYPGMATTINTLLR